MSSGDLFFSSGLADADAGLLAPIWAGTPVAAATDDVAFLQAMLDAEAALARAQAEVEHSSVLAAAAAAVTAAARAECFNVRDLALRARAGGIRSFRWWPI